MLACKFPDTNTARYSLTEVESFVPKLSQSKAPTLNRSSNTLETANPLLTKNTVTLTLENGETTPEALNDKVSKLLTDMNPGVSYNIRVVNKFKAAIKTNNLEAANKVVGVFDTAKPFEGKYKIAII